MYMSKSKRNYDKLGMMRTSESTQVLTLSPQQQQYRNDRNRLMMLLMATVIVCTLFISTLFIWHNLHYKLNTKDPNTRMKMVVNQIVNNVTVQVSCEEVQFSYLLLALRWPNTFCYQNQCLNSTGNYYLDWTIHGLWPNYEDGDYPAFCCPDWSFGLKQLDPIKESLNNRWTNLQANSNESSLWKHEWDKHGTCCLSSDVLNSEFKYFNQTLDLFNQYPIRKWLEAQSILPSSDAIAYSKIQNAIAAEYHNKFLITCASVNQTQMLDTIYLCLEPERLNPIDCPDNMAAGKRFKDYSLGSYGCSKSVVYPMNDKITKH